MSNNYFTPIFIIVAFFIGIGGVVVTNFIDSLFIDNPYRKIVQLFSLTIILNIIILVFLIMSFGKIKNTEGPKGPKGIKGSSGLLGKDGHLKTCGKQSYSVYDARNLDMVTKDLDLTPPTIID